MAIERREQVRVARTPDGNFERQQKVTEYAPPIQNIILSRISKLLWLGAGLMIAALTFRFFLMLIAANPGNGFVAFIYNITGPLVMPFANITPTPVFGDGNAVDVAAVFAMVVIVLIVWSFVRLLYILFKAPSGSRHETTIVQDS